MLAGSMALVAWGWLALAAAAIPTTPTLCQGNWALGFVVLPGCPACETLLGWLSEASTRFPELHLLVVVPWETPELAGSPLEVFVDQAGELAGALGIRRAPTLVLLSWGRQASRLDWPFSEAELLSSLESLSQVERQGPQVLVGQPAPAFSGLDLGGQPAGWEGPVLLVFVNPGCPPCREALAALGELAQLSVALLVGEGRLSEDDRSWLSELSAREGWSVLMVPPQVWGAYRVLRTPTFFLVDKEGVICWAKEGFSSGTGLVAEIGEALAELAGEEAEKGGG